jgi:hypothetical protein
MRKNKGGDSRSTNTNSKEQEVRDKTKSISAFSPPNVLTASLVP